MKLILCLCLAVVAVSVVADVTELPSDSVVPEAMSESSVVPEMVEMEMEVDASFQEAKTAVNELLQAGKTDAACRNLAKTTAVEVNDSVAASQKAVANMPNGSQCNNEGQHLIKKAEEDKTKADKAEKDALNKVNAAKSAKINFGDYVVSSLDGKSCGYFYNTQVWKNAQAKIQSAEQHYNKKKAEAQAAKKAVQTAKDEAAKLVKKCKCTSKQAIESAIANFNAKSKAANTAAWKKSYHMICVLDAKPANKCHVPALPEVKPVPFAHGVGNSCPPPTRAPTPRPTPKPTPKPTPAPTKAPTKAPTPPVHQFLNIAGVTTRHRVMNYMTGGSAGPHDHFELYKMAATNGFHDNANGMQHYINICLRAGLKAVGCGTIGNYDASHNVDSIAMPSSWSCNMMTPLGAANKGGMGNNIVALQEKIGNSAALYALNGRGVSMHPNGNMYLHPVCGRKVSDAHGAKKIITNYKTGGSAGPHTHFELVKMPAQTGFSDDHNGMNKYVNLCVAAGLKAVGCGTIGNYDASHNGNSIAMPSSWGCNMMGPLGAANQGGMGNNIVALQEKIGNSAALYALGGNGQQMHPHSSMKLHPICGKKI